MEPIQRRRPGSSLSRANPKRPERSQVYGNHQYGGYSQSHAQAFDIGFVTMRWNVNDHDDSASFVVSIDGAPVSTALVMN